MRRKFTKSLFSGHLNVNSERNKFEALEFVIKDKFEVFFVSESKLDSSFSEAQFKIPGYRVFRQDEDKYGSDLMFYIDQNIPFKKIETFHLHPLLEIFTLEINLGKEKQLIFGTYEPPNINNGIDHIIINILKRVMISMTLETGTSDHQKMIMNIFRSTVAKRKPKTFFYRCYKQFDLD